MASRTKAFDLTPQVNPARSIFDLSHTKKMTADFGYLYPVLAEEVVPGDHWTIGNQALVRMQPLVSPAMHEINIYTHYFFVPFRLLWEGWENFISGGKDGNDISSAPEWQRSNTDRSPGNDNISLWDYLGFPQHLSNMVTPPMTIFPTDFARRAYFMIYNEFYRDQNLIDEFDIHNLTPQNDLLLLRAWEKDYFTSALPWQQRGTPPALPVTLSGSAHWDDLYGTHYDNALPEGSASYLRSVKDLHTAPMRIDAEISNSYTEGLRSVLNDNRLQAVTSTFDIADLRLALQLQVWMERNARSGARYTEFLRAHFGVSPRDERLQRPEYIGGTKSGIIISEVLQTSEDNNTPQGNMAGHGIGLSSGFGGKFYAQEFGVVMGIMSIMPRLSYSNQGFNRQWLRKTRYDYFFPEFANLSEQEVLNAEILSLDNPQGIFGFQGRYNEMRFKPNQVVGQMRDIFKYWHLSRSFGNVPILNKEFIECNPETQDLKRIFAVPTEPGFIIDFANLITAVRPIPVYPEPSVI